MSLLVTCRCGQSLQAQPHLAGLQVACPSCGGPLKIPLLIPPQSAAPTLEPLDATLAEPYPGSGRAPLDPLAPAQPDPQFGSNASFPMASGSLPRPNYSPTVQPMPMPKPMSVGEGPSSARIVVLVVGLLLVGMVVFGVAAVFAVRQLSSGSNVQDGPGIPLALKPNAVVTWQTHISPEGGFSIDIKHPIEIKSAHDPDIDGPMRMISVLHQEKVGGYIVSYGDYSNPVAGGDAMNVLNGVCDQLGSIIQGTVTDRSTITINGHTALEFRAKGTTAGRPVESHARIVVANTRLFQVIWSGESGTEPHEDTQRFLSSFQIDSNKFPAGRGGLE